MANLLEPEKGEGTGVRRDHYKQGKQAETASPGCGITQTLSRVLFSRREFESHQEDLGRKRLDPCGSCFKKIASLITSEWTVRIYVSRTLGLTDKNGNAKHFLFCTCSAITLKYQQVYSMK